MKLLLLACLAATALVSGGCVAPAALRKGPEPVSFKPISDTNKQLADNSKKNAVTIAKQAETIKDLRDTLNSAAARLEDKEGKALTTLTAEEITELRVDLGMAKSKAAKLEESNKELKQQRDEDDVIIKAQGERIELVEAQVKKSAQAYKELAIAKWQEQEKRIWMQWLTGYPVAFILGMFTGAILLFVFRAVLKAAWFTVKTYLHIP